MHGNHVTDRSDIGSFCHGNLNMMLLNLIISLKEIMEEFFWK